MSKYRYRRKPRSRGAWFFASTTWILRLVTAAGVAIIAAIPLAAHCRAGAADSELTLSQQRDAAVHEAGHAVVSYYISPEFALAVEVRVQVPENLTYWGVTRRDHGAAADPKEEALWRLGGLAAEEVFLGNAPPADYKDKDDATQGLMHGVCRSEEDCPCVPELLRGEAKICLLVDRAMRELNTGLYPRAKAIIRANQAAVGALADQIMLQEPRNGARRLTAREVAEFFKEHPVARQPLVAAKE